MLDGILIALLSAGAVLLAWQLLSRRQARGGISGKWSGNHLSMDRIHG